MTVEIGVPTGEGAGLLALFGIEIGAFGLFWVLMLAALCSIIWYFAHDAAVFIALGAWFMRQLAALKGTLSPRGDRKRT